MSVQPLINLYGLDREQLEQLFIEQGLQAFRGRQLMKWVYHQGRTDFMAMTDLPLSMREWLEENANFELPRLTTAPSRLACDERDGSASSHG